MLRITSKDTFSFLLIFASVDVDIPVFIRKSVFVIPLSIILALGVAQIVTVSGCNWIMCLGCEWEHDIYKFSSSDLQIQETHLWKRELLPQDHRRSVSPLSRLLEINYRIHSNFLDEKGVFSHVFAILCTVARQAPPSMGFPRQEYRSGLPFPSPIFPTQG